VKNENIGGNKEDDIERERIEMKKIKVIMKEIKEL
jgi:hypothetical protein